MTPKTPSKIAIVLQKIILIFLLCILIVPQSFAQRHRFPPRPWWRDSVRFERHWRDSMPPMRDSIPHWRDSFPRGRDTTSIDGHHWGGRLDSLRHLWRDSLHMWLDSLRGQWRDSGFTRHDSGRFPPPPPIDSGRGGFPPPPPCDSGRTGQDTGHRDGGGRPGGHRLAGTDNSTATVSVSIYPNPVTESAVVHIENTFGTVIFRMYDSNGRLALTRTFTNGDFQLNKDNYTGVYFYEINDGDTSLYKGKMIFQ